MPAGDPHHPLKIVIINRSDARGGAAVVSFRLMQALRFQGADAQMLTVEKLTDSPFVHCVGPREAKIPFLLERLQIFCSNGLSKKHLFQADTAAFGLPLWKHPLVREADAICLGWVNQGMLSLKGIRKIAALGLPVVWTMHDMWCATGICHHAGTCRHFTRQCGDCHLLGVKRSPRDLSARVWHNKQHLYNRCNISFVAVSDWLKQKCRQSTLLAHADVNVIPNPFPLEELFHLAEHSPQNRQNGQITIITGAARLDDPIKGMPLLTGATKILQGKYPELAAQCRLLTFGNLKNPDALADVAIPHTHLGPLASMQDVARAYSKAQIVLSSSHYETLPGTLVEGQAYGCIPVAFISGGQPDIITDTQTGFLAPYSGNSLTDAEALADALAKAIKTASDKEKYAGMKIKMTESVKEKFSADSVAAQYIQLFRRLRDNT